MDRTGGAANAAVRLNKNSGTILAPSIVGIPFQSSNAAQVATVTLLVSLVSGDTLRLQAFASGSNVQRFTNNVAGEISASLSAVRIQ